MNHHSDRMQTVALRGVGLLLWPESDHIMTDAERIEGARRLVDKGEAQASLYYCALLDVAYAAVQSELDSMRESLRRRPAGWV